MLRQKVVGSLYLEAGQLRELDLGSLSLFAERINRKLVKGKKRDWHNWLKS